MYNILRFVGTSDLNLFLYLHHRLHCKTLNKIMPLITQLGGARFTIAISLFLIFMGRGESRFIATKGTISLAISFILGFFLKKILSRPRPYMVISNINVIDKIWKDYSFPSGHTTAAFSLATNYAMFYTQFLIPLTLVATLIGVSRIYLGHHYPSDILVGGALGIGTTIFVHMI